MMTFEEEDDRFYIAESTIKGAGKGIFAKRHIKKGEYLYITGVKVKRNSVGDECTYFFNPYKFAANVKVKGDLVDMGDYVIVPLGYAGIINHSDENYNVEIRYCGDDYPKRSTHAGKALYWFIRDVQKDEEVFGNYGHAWGKLLGDINEIKNKVDYKKADWEEFIDFDLYGISELVD